MKNTYKFLIQAFLWLITVNPILTNSPSFQFARLDPSVAYQNKSQIQVQPIFYTSCISRKQQELYEKMILTHAQNQEYLKTKNQEPRFTLNLKNKEQQTALTQAWHQELAKAQQVADTEQITRLTRRLQALTYTIPANKGALNSELESCLLYEFKESYTTAKQLEQQFPALPHLKTVAPLIYDCAEAATKETGILQAFKYSDLAHHVLTICTKAANFIGKVRTAVGKGIIKGATQSAHNLYQLTKPDHWVALATQLKHFATIAAQECVKAEEFSELLFPTTDKNYDQKFDRCMAQYRAESSAMHATMKTTWNKLKETPWEQLTENGVALGASLVLDYVTLNAIGAVTSAATNKVIEELATVFKQEKIVQEAYLIEVAGVGKMQLEGKALTQANKLKNITQKETELISKQNPKQPCQPKESNVQFDFDDGDFVHPSTAVDRKGQKKVQKFLEKRKPTIIHGRIYSAHAIERMQERGITPMVVENSIAYGIPHKFPEPETFCFYEAENEIEVAINSIDKKVITVIQISEDEAIRKGHNVIKKKSK